MKFDPFALQFYIKADWNVRPDDVSSIALQLLRYIDALIPLHPTLAEWRLGENWESLLAIRSDMAAFVRRSVHHDEDGEADPKEGYSIVGLSCDKRQLFSFLGNVGRFYQRPIANDFSFETYSNGPADKTIVTRQLIKQIVLITIAVWRPDFCAAYSSELEPDHKEGLYRKAWMIYVPPPNADSIDLVGVPFSEWTPDGGLLLSATEQTFDAANPAHVAGARRLHEATRHLNPPSDYEDWEDDDDDDLPGETIN